MKKCKFNYKYIMLFCFMFLPNIILAKGYTMDYSSSLTARAHFTNFFSLNGKLLFGGAASPSFTSPNNSMTFYQKTPYQSDGSYIYKTYEDIKNTGLVNIPRVVLPTNDGGYLLVSEYYSNRNYSFIEKVSSNFTLQWSRRSSERVTSNSTAITIPNSNDIIWFYSYNNSSYTSVIDYVSRINQKGDTIRSGYMANQYYNGIAFNDGSILAIGENIISKIVHNGSDSYSVKFNYNVPIQGKFNQIIDMKDGTYIISGVTTDSKTSFVKVDANGNVLASKILAIDPCDTRYANYGNKLRTYMCYKDNNKLLVYGYYSGSPSLIEMNSNLEVISIDPIEVPHDFLQLPYVAPAICQDIKIIDKKVIILFLLGDSEKERSHYAIYSPVPPTIRISADYQRIGDNTPITININASEDYPTLCISNLETGQNVYLGNPTTRHSFYWNKSGDFNFSAAIYDTDGTTLSTSNTIYINQSNLLGKVLDVIDGKSTLQKMVILDDTDRYYENNTINQGIVSQIKERVDGIFLINNDVSPVLAPLLELN